jgi:hypothetical protein
MEESDFSSDIENILENIRLNSIVLSKEHRKRYVFLKKTLKYYRIPIIIISALNSVISIGASNFTSQEYVSVATCLLALICGMISSIELFFGINTQMEIELSSSKEYYILSTDIFKMLSLNKANRNTEGKAFLNDCYARYIKLIETSCITKRKIEDNLAPLPKPLSSLVISQSNVNLETSSDSTF